MCWLMESTDQKFLAEVRRFQSRNPSVSDARVGRESVNDGGLIARLVDGGTITHRTADRVRAWMRDYDAERSACAA